MTLDPKTEGSASTLPGQPKLRRWADRFRAPEALRNYFRGTDLRFSPTERQRLFALTAAIGGICGLVAVGFHLFIDLVSKVAIDRALSAPRYSWVIWTILVPTLGGLISGVLLEFVVPNARGSGIPQVKAAYAGKGPPLRMRDSVGKFFISAFQIGTGSSLGREGPTVQICAGVATRVGRFAGVSVQNLRRLLPVGAAAGIAAAFNAPIAAVTFTIEEVVGNLDQTVLSGVVVAAALAAIVERSVLGVQPVFAIQLQYGLEHISSLLFYAVLGLISALLGLLFTESLLRLRGWFKGPRRLPRWAHPGIGGLVTGALAAIALEFLGTQGVTGGGYATVTAALGGKLAVAVLIPLCLMKLVATVFSYSSGGAGGIFAPALFIGAMAGGAVGGLDVLVFHHSTESLGAFALVGMGAVFAAIIRAPITSVLIIIEMTGGYSLILPLMIANMLAYGIARHYRPTPIYEALLEQDGIQLREKMVLAEVLESIPLREVPLDNRAHASFVPDTPMSALLQAMSENSRQEVFPVVRDESLVGIVTLEDLLMVTGRPELEGLVNAADLMRAPVSLRADENLRVAFETMLTQGLRELPVTDDRGQVVGFVDETSIAHAYMVARQKAKQ